jgi:hypothetical protein
VRRADDKQSSRLVVAMAVVVSGLCGLGACGAQASRSSDPTSDVTTTGTYLRARLSLQESIERNLISSQARVEHYAASAERRCGGIAAKVPRGREFDELNYDALVAVEIVMAEGSTAGMVQFASVTEGLGWGQTRLTLLVRRLAGGERALARVVPLDICSVFTEWTHSGYHAVPPAAVRFEHEISSFSMRSVTRCERLPSSGRSICSRARPEKPIAEEIGRLLKQYEDGKQRARMSKTEQIERRLARRTRATLTAVTSALTRRLALDPFALRLFIASLREL